MENNKLANWRELIPLLGIGILGGLIGAGLMFGWLHGGGRTSLSQTSLNGQNLVVQEDSAVISAVQKVSPSVVSISFTSQVQNLFGRVYEAKGGGTGFIVSQDGLIVTNRHVVQGQDKLQVITADGKSYDAKVMTIDSMNDIAIIKISASNLPVVEFGDTSKLQVGQKVIAIGNALGQYQNTVTSGVVSAIGRVITAGDGNGKTETLENVIQTDASINPGNSGGPLINLAGQVIGINTAVDQQGSQIGFAIPVELAKTSLASYLKSGKITRPFLGINYINISKELAATQKLPVDEGAIIVKSSQNTAGVQAGGPADKAGLKEGDIIQAIDGQNITANKGLLTLLQSHQPGDTITLKVLRDGKKIDIKVTLGESK